MSQDKIITFEYSPNIDDRGEFTRIIDFNDKIFKDSNLKSQQFCQFSFSRSLKKGTRRGLHLLLWPDSEVKIVKALRGSFFDVVVDCRPNSKTFGKWQSFQLDSKIGNGIVVPKGFAHGIETLADDTLIFYAMDRPYTFSKDVTISLVDSQIDINWPSINPSITSAKDSNGMTLTSYVDLLRDKE
jgi:dTDP-4-dehydrorhamnose 3,5-epimerase